MILIKWVILRLSSVTYIYFCVHYIFDAMLCCYICQFMHLLPSAFKILKIEVSYECVHIQSHRYILACILHTCIHTWMFIYIHMYTYIETHAFIYTRTYVHSHTCLHTHMYKQVYIHIPIHMYVYRHTQTHTPLMVEISIVSLHQVPSVIDNIACGYKLSGVEIKKGMLGPALWHHFDRQEEEKWRSSQE